MSLLSVIIPVYDEEDSLDYVLPALHEVLDSEDVSFEVIFVDDGSTDGSYSKIVELTKAAPNVKGYRFSRNFGKESAIWAGLQKANGDCCVVMDCDLQHPPETLPKMLKLWKDGYKIVEGIKVRRKESFFYKIHSGLFYRLISSLSKLDMLASSDFKLLDRAVIDALVKLDERNTLFRGLSFWVGFSSAKVEFEVAPRKHGKTKWSYSGLAKYALSSISSFSTSPMQIVTFLGALFFVFAIILGIQTLYQFIIGHSADGFTTIILLILLTGGGIMVSLGIIGLYISKIYEEVKARPRFIISDTTEE
jgi:dolichol-phosphate mannosyltransferase